MARAAPTGVGQHGVATMRLVWYRPRHSSCVHILRDANTLPVLTVSPLHSPPAARATVARAGGQLREGFPAFFIRMWQRLSPTNREMGTAPAMEQRNIMRISHEWPATTRRLLMRLGIAGMIALVVTACGDEAAAGPTATTAAPTRAATVGAGSPAAGSVVAPTRAASAVVGGSAVAGSAVAGSAVVATPTRAASAVAGSPVVGGAVTATPTRTP